jgi:hypothetical protein
LANVEKLLALTVVYGFLVVWDIVLTIKKLKRQGLATELNKWIRWSARYFGLENGVIFAVTLESLMWLFIAYALQSPVFLGILVGFRLCLALFQSFAESLA